MANLHQIHEKLRLSQIVMRECTKDMPAEMGADTAFALGVMLASIETACALVGRDIDDGRRRAAIKSVAILGEPPAGETSKPDMDTRASAGPGDSSTVLWPSDRATGLPLARPWKRD